MPRIAPGLLALAVSLLVVPAAPAAQQPAGHPRVVYFNDAGRKKPVRPHPYGFLPGYRPPEVIEWQRRQHYWASGPHFYGPAWPGFVHNRWDGGGLGPCYTYTPIGYIWNCGK